MNKVWMIYLVRNFKNEESVLMFKCHHSYSDVI